MAFRRGNDTYSRITNELAAVGAHLEETFSALGKAYYAAHGKEENGEFKEYADEIAKTERKAEIFGKLLERTRGVKVCPNCKAEVPKESAFCNLCGTKIPEPEALTDGENVYCDECACPMPIGQKFCSFCGALLPVTGDAPVEAPAEEPVEAPVEVPAEAQVEEPAAEEPAPETPAVEESAAEAPVEEPAAPQPEPQVCPACGKILPPEVKFCTGCGQNLSAPVAPAVPVCPNCGKEIKEGALFCTGCGTKLA